MQTSWKALVALIEAMFVEIAFKPGDGLLAPEPLDTDGECRTPCGILYQNGAELVGNAR